VAGCCAPREYRRFFNRKLAAREARRYREEGLPATGRVLASFADDVAGATVLEVGGGLATIGLQLLEDGAERCTTIDISGAYEEEARALLAERGLEGSMERRVGDFLTETVEPHDIVVLHRVVCCYPDVDALVGAAAEHTRSRLLLTYPRERLLTRMGAPVINAWLYLSRCGFRTYVHPVERILAAAAAHGLVPAERERSGLIWESAVLTRA
jgi:magnesium-protoporphyrin O-methyltransferase